MATPPASSPDRPLRPEQLADLRRQFGKLSMTALYDAYHAAWIRCKVEQNGRAPSAAHVQELVQVWRELRKLAGR